MGCNNYSITVPPDSLYPWTDPILNREYLLLTTGRNQSSQIDDFAINSDSNVEKQNDLEPCWNIGRCCSPTNRTHVARTLVIIKVLMLFQRHHQTKNVCVKHEIYVADESETPSVTSYNRGYSRGG